MSQHFFATIAGRAVPGATDGNSGPPTQTQTYTVPSAPYHAAMAPPGHMGYGGSFMGPPSAHTGFPYMQYGQMMPMMMMASFANQQMAAQAQGGYPYPFPYHYGPGMGASMGMHPSFHGGASAGAGVGRLPSGSASTVATAAPSMPSGAQASLAAAGGSAISFNRGSSAYSGSGGVSSGHAQSSSSSTSAPSKPPPKAHPQKADSLAGPKTASEGAFSCKPCDRGFDSSKDLVAHSASHVKCHVATCEFSGSRRVVMEHVSREHRPKQTDSGRSRVKMPASLLELIPPKYRAAHRLGDAEPDIDQWRLERKKRFPTAEVVAGKVAAKQESSFRGASESAGGKGKGRERVAAAASASSSMPRSTGEGGGVSESTSELESKAATGTHDVSLEDKADDDDDGVPEEVGSSLSASASQRPAFTHHDDDGGDDNDDGVVGVDGAARPTPAKRRRIDGEASDKVSTVNTSAAATPVSGSRDGTARVSVRRPCRVFWKGKCKDGAACPFSHDATDKAAIETSKGKAANKGKVGATKPPCRQFILGDCQKGAACPLSHGLAVATATQSNLCRRLLKDQVDRELSYTLQCLRYVVQKGFFPPAPSAPLQGVPSDHHDDYAHSYAPLIEVVDTSAIPNASVPV